MPLYALCVWRNGNSLYIQLGVHKFQHHFLDGLLREMCGGVCRTFQHIEFRTDVMSSQLVMQPQGTLGGYHIVLISVEEEEGRGIRCDVSDGAELLQLVRAAAREVVE